MSRDARGIDMGPQPKWRFRLYDDSTHNFHVPEAPCLFHRVTQRLILGLVWERLEEPNGLVHRAWRRVKGWL